MDIEDFWNEPENGLTQADFDRWPGRLPFSRAHSADLMYEALKSGALVLPAHLIGVFTVYDIAHSHPSGAGATHESVPFIVSGFYAPVVSTLQTRGIVSRRFVTRRLPTFDRAEIEPVSTQRGRYFDVAMTNHGIPTSRVGFSCNDGGECLALARAQAFVNAVDRVLSVLRV